MVRRQLFIHKLPRSRIATRNADHPLRRQMLAARTRKKRKRKTTKTIASDRRAFGAMAMIAAPTARTAPSLSIRSDNQRGCVVIEINQ